MTWPLVTALSAIGRSWRRRLARAADAAWLPALVLLVVTLLTWALWLGVEEWRIPGQAERELGGDAVCGAADHRTVRCVLGGQPFVCVRRDGRVRCAAWRAEAPAP